MVKNCQDKLPSSRTLTRLEILNVLRRHLRYFEQSHGAIVIDKSSTLDIGFGFVSDLHQELGLGVDHVLEDLLVDTE